MKKNIEWDRLSNDSRKLWELSRKLASLGIVLERHGEAEEGFTALHGFGMILTGISSELENLASDVETVCIQGARH